MGLLPKVDGISGTEAADVETFRTVKLKILAKGSLVSVRSIVCPLVAHAMLQHEVSLNEFM